MKEKKPAAAKPAKPPRSARPQHNEKKGTNSAAAPTIPYEGSSAQSDVRITKSNALIEASYRLTLMETRLLMICIGHIDSRAPLDEQRIFRVHAAEFQARFGLGREKAFEALKEVEERLFERRVIVRDPVTGKVNDKIHWVSAVRYLHGQGAIQLHFSPEILPYISAIRERFTSYSLSAVSAFSSTFAIRLYEILDQYRLLGKRTATVEDLRRWLDCVDKFDRYTDFERWAIKVGVDQINEHSDLRVTYRKIKQGRSVTHIEFTFSALRQTVAKAEGAAKPVVKVVSAAEDSAEAERRWRAQMAQYGFDPDAMKPVPGGALDPAPTVEHSGDDRKKKAAKS